MFKAKKESKPLNKDPTRRKPQERKKLSSHAIESKKKREMKRNYIGFSKAWIGYNMKVE